jgi:putative endonuclease
MRAEARRRQADQMNGFYYVYTLQSTAFPDEHYTDQTGDIQQRLTEHNSGKVPHTSKSKP